MASNMSRSTRTIHTLFLDISEVAYDLSELDDIEVVLQTPSGQTTMKLSYRQRMALLGPQVDFSDRPVPKTALKH